MLTGLSAFQSFVVSSTDCEEFVASGHWTWNARNLLPVDQWCQMSGFYGQQECLRCILKPG